MSEQNPRAVIGANNPPSQIDEINATYEPWRMEAENWLDGAAVENEGQMAVVDDLRAKAREWRLALEKGQKSATAPLHEVYKAELAAWKPSIEDAQLIEKGLVAAVDGFKRKLAAEKAEAERLARAEAEAKARAAHEAAQAAQVSDIETQRAAAQAQREAEAAAMAVKQAERENNVKGLRTVTRYEVTDYKALLNWIARNDRDAMTAFIDEWARVKHKTTAADGLRVWTEKESF